MRHTTSPSRARAGLIRGGARLPAGRAAGDRLPRPQPAHRDRQPAAAAAGHPGGPRAVGDARRAADDSARPVLRPAGPAGATARPPPPARGDARGLRARHRGGGGAARHRHGRCALRRQHPGRRLRGDGTDRAAGPDPDRLPPRRGEDDGQLLDGAPDRRHAGRRSRRAAAGGPRRIVAGLAGTVGDPGGAGRGPVAGACAAPQDADHGTRAGAPARPAARVVGRALLRRPVRRLLRHAGLAAGDPRRGRLVGALGRRAARPRQPRVRRARPAAAGDRRPPHLPGAARGRGHHHGGHRCARACCWRPGSPRCGWC